MNWAIRLLCLLLWIVACDGSRNETKTPPTVQKERAETRYLIEATDLVPLLAESNVKVIDFRRGASYKLGHIPGSISFWRSDIEDSSFPYSGMKANAAQLEKLFGNAGIENVDQVIIYDEVGSCDALRLWWVLQAYDFQSVKILDGGWDAWNDIGGRTSTEVTKRTPTNFKLSGRENPSISISSAELADAISNQEGLVILDTRTMNEFSGKQMKQGAKSAGRILRSIHSDWVVNINHSGNKKIKSLEELATSYQDLNLSKDQPIITYCHTGVRSSVTYFVLTELLHFTNVRNYDGSWVEWSHLQLPSVQDSTTEITN